MFERFHWRRLGGSVFRYDGVEQADDSPHEDWLNHIAPALMFLRSFLIARNIKLKVLTVDATSISFLDHSEPDILLGTAPQRGDEIVLAEPTNPQSSEATVRSFIDAAVAATQ